MQKVIKLWLERSCLYIAIICTLIILLLSLVKTNNLPIPKISNIDKLEHLFAYGVLSFFWVSTQAFRKIKIKVSYLLIMIILYGIIIEILQAGLTSYRSGDFYDFVANSIGVLIGYIFFKIVANLYLEV